MQGPEETPKAPLANNVRPLQPLHHRTIRTNIDFDGKSHQVSFGLGAFSPFSDTICVSAH
jgi:hypothetical protein